MDGMPAFSTCWVSGYIERLPGNHNSMHATNTDRVTSMYWSSKLLRYLYSRS